MMRREGKVRGMRRRRSWLKEVGRGGAKVERGGGRQMPGHRKYQVRLLANFQVKCHLENKNIISDGGSTAVL